MSGSTQSTGPKDASAFSEAYPSMRRWGVALGAIALGVVIAGFWNYHVVDGFGESVVAGPLVGDTSEAAGAFGSSGPLFGMVFAVAAGLAATFTACNCVVFAMIPELASRSGQGVDRRGILKTLGTFVGGVVLVGIPYGAFVGMLGPEGMEAMNSSAVRLAQAQAVFTFIGVCLLVWGAIEMGLLSGLVNRLAPETRAFFSRPTTRAGILGLFVGAFAVGRPFSVFRDMLTFAANAESPLYGAAVMVVNDLAMIAFMVVLLLAMVYLAGGALSRWIERNPHGPQMVSGFALLAGGAYFVFYWGLAFAFGVGRWGFRLGWYG